MSKVKIAVIGCGWVSQIHVEKLKAFEDVEIVGFFSNNPEKARMMRDSIGSGRCYDSYIEMFDVEKPDGVYICIIPSTHGEYELEAIKRGIHIFVEKPISLSGAQSDKIGEEAEKAGIVTCVGYQERYLDIIDKTKEYLEGRKIGLVQGAWLGDIPGALWWKKKAMSGGQIVEQCTHVFDMLRYLLGEPESVFCRGGKGIITDIPDYDIEDYSSTVVTFKNGIIANVFTGCYFGDAKKLPNGINFYAADATIEYDLRKSVRIFTGNKSEEYFNGNDSFQAINRAFIDDIKNGNKKAIRSNYADSIKTLKFTLACNKSIETGVPVYL